MPNGDPSGLGQATAAAPAACGNNDVGGGAAGCGTALAAPVDVDREIAGIGDEPPEPVLTPVGPVINVAKPYALVHKDYLPDNTAVRVKVHLTTDSAFDGTGTLTITTPDDSSAGLAFYHSEHGDDFWFDSYTQDFPGDDLTIGIDLWAQGVTPSSKLGDITLELKLSGGTKPIKPPVQGTLTAVEVTLDLCMSRATLGADPVPLSDADKINTGRFVHVQKAQHHGRALLAVRKAQPPDFPGTLVLLRDNAKVRIFNDEVPAAGQAAIALPHNFPNGGIPADGQKYWVEGVTASSALLDTGFKLGVQGLTKQDGDWAKLTVVELKNLTADVPITPANHERLGNKPARHNMKLGSAPKHYSDKFDENRPLVVVENSLEDLNLSVQIAPATVPFGWTIERARQPGTATPLDHADIVNMAFGGTPLLDPTDSASATATLNSSAPGSFHVRAYVDCNGSGSFQGDDPATGQRIDREPFVVLNYIVARVQGFKNTSRATAANRNIIPAAPTAATGVGISTGQWASGGVAAAWNRAKFTVIGGGPDGKLGLDEVFAGWAQNITDSAIHRRYTDAGPPVVQHFERFVFASNNPDPAHPAQGIFRPAAIAAPLGVLSSTAAPAILALPILDVTTFGAEGRGANSCVGTEGAIGPPGGIVKANLPTADHALAYGQDWYVQQWDSPGLNAGANAQLHPAAQLSAFQFDLDFRTDLVVWTNIGKTPNNNGLAACRLYSTVQTDTWTIRFRVTFDAAGNLHTPVPLALALTKDSDPTRLASKVSDEDFEVRFPVALQMYAVDCR